MKTIIRLCLLSCTWFLMQTSFAQIVVVVGAKSSVSNLTREQAAAIFLGKATQLPGAGEPQLVDLQESNEVRKNFYLKVADKTPTQVKAIWARLVFSGKASPPKELPSSGDVKKFVNSSHDAIGYIEKSAVDSSVKVLLEVE